MAAKKGNGHDAATVQMVQLLERIADDIHGLRGEMNARFEALTKITENGFRHVHERIDEAHEEAVRNTERLTAVPDGVEARLRRLEAAVFKKAS
jgi:hypothetical protein